MYHPTTRVLTTLELLQTYGRMTGMELANRLEVNIRTARRYIEMLQELGIPVEAERGRFGAYRLRPGYKLPPLLFTEDEALALILSLRIARKRGFSLAVPTLEGALAKINRVLPEQVRTRLQALEQTLVLDMEVRSELLATTVVILLGTAIQAERRVQLCYRSARGEETEREVEPYGMVYRKDQWYLIGYCLLRREERLFRLDRIISAHLRPESFVRPAGYDLEEHVHRSLASVPGRWRVEVLLKTTLKQAQQLISSSMAQLEETAYGILFQCNTDNLPWMARFLAQLGIEMTICQPDELRLELRKHALTLLSYIEPVQPQKA